MPTPDIAISLVLPIHNGLPFLRECLDAVRAQSLTSFELVVADDGSTDGSAAFIDEYFREAKDSRLRFLPSSGPRRGVFATINRIVAESRGSLLHFLGQDDRLHPECLAETARFFSRHPEIAIAFAKYQAIDRAGTIVGAQPLGDIPEVILPDVALQRFFYEGSFAGSLSAVCIRRKTFEWAGGFDESYGLAADYELLSRACFRWSLGIIHRYLLQVRHHPAQLSNATGTRSELVAEYRRVRANLIPLLPGPIQEYARRFELRRHFVDDFDYAMRELRAGRLREFARVGRALGASDWFRAGTLWVLTMDNRFWRPKPKYMALESESISLRRAG